MAKIYSGVATTGPDPASTAPAPGQVVAINREPETEE